ncbi:MAG: ATP-grasp domain-containing protein [Acidobacteriota bacterium]
MVNVIFAAPLLSENAALTISAAGVLPDVRLGVISMDPLERLEPSAREFVEFHWRIDDILDSNALASAVTQFSERFGPVDRLFAAFEQLQIPLAEVRERFGIAGLSSEAAKNFRDKGRMKELLQAAGIPCARHRTVISPAQARHFVSEIGFPVVVKPPAGAGSLSTFRIDDPEQLDEVLGFISLSPGQPALIEEFISGEEHSFESVTVEGQPVWHSLTSYEPSALDVVRNQWIQWCVLVPREIDDPQYDDIRQAAKRALEVLGMTTGLTHMEWFRRVDGTIAISEVAARPPGAHFMALHSIAHDFDLEQAWVRLMVFGTFDPPVQKYAAGAAYLRGQGEGRVRAVYGLNELEPEIQQMVVQSRLPWPGQRPTGSYEGEGYVVVRDIDTERVRQALRRIVKVVRVELGA